jgi:hypothetical protein
MLARNMRMKTMNNQSHDLKKDKIMADMRGYLFKNSVVKIVDINGTSEQGRVFSIDLGYGITIFTGTMGHKRAFKFENIRSYGVF